MTTREMAEESGPWQIENSLYGWRVVHTDGRYFYVANSSAGTVARQLLNALEAKALELEQDAAFDQASIMTHIAHLAELGRENADLCARLEAAEAERDRNNQARKDAEQWAMRAEHEKADVEADLAIYTTLLRQAKEWAVVLHKEGDPLTAPMAWAWYECRLCLTTWRDFSDPKHGEDCPVIAIASALEEPES